MELNQESSIPEEILCALEDLTTICDEATECVAWIALVADKATATD